MSPDTLPEMLKSLVVANHILHYHQVVDAYGHISLRHPERHDVFIMSGSVAPALVESADDFIHYRVSDGSPVDPAATKGYQERFIHSEIYKRFPKVNSVVHSHSENVLPYTISGVVLRPAFHVPGFLGSSVPIFDIGEHYGDSDRQDMLVNTEVLGAVFAAKFSNDKEKGLENTVVLMKSHGFTTCGKDVKQATYRAVYTHNNARVQTNAILLNNSLDNKAIAVQYLTDRQVQGCTVFGDETSDRPWGLWVREVEAAPLYRNRT